MKIAHVSDTHGQLWPEIPDECDFVVHSGDGIPNASRGNLQIEIPFQTKWITDNIENYRKWLKGKTLLYCQGNHCFIDACEVLNHHNIPAIDLTNKVIEHQGIIFYGFPYINYIAGEWNHERLLQDLNNEMQYMKERIKEAGLGLDILVAHAPPWGICDTYAGMHLGNSLLTNEITYQQLDPMPKHIFCGHIHEAGGFGELFDVKISQAATLVHVIEYDPEPIEDKS